MKHEGRLVKMSDLPKPTRKALKHIKAAIKEGYGDRCNHYNPGCIGCATWRAFDDLVLAMDFCRGL